MNDLKAKVLTYLNGLAPRERLMVTILVSVVALLLIYSLISQIFDFKNKYQVLAEKNERDYQWIEANIGQASTMSSQGDTPDAVSRNIRLVANKLMRQYSIKSARTQPSGDAGLVIDFKAVEFDTFWRWLAQLKKETHSEVSNISVSKTGVAGLVDIRLEVESH